jgi:hypothetical protein
MAALPKPPAALAPPEPGQQRWLLVYHCLHIGLANCLRMLAPGLHVENVDLPRFRKHFSEYLPRLDGYDRIVSTGQLLGKELAFLNDTGRTRAIPLPFFDAYHPDNCFVYDASGAMLKLPMGTYHSKIVVAGYMQGRTAAQIRAQFHGRNYERFGYCDLASWDADKQRLLGGFAAAGLALDDRFPSWGALEPFMFTGSHPAIRVVADIARVLLRAEGIEPLAIPVLPLDNLVHGPVYPVYPEIAESLSLRGSLLFKLPDSYRYIDLDQFIAGSLAALAPHDPSSLSINIGHSASFDRVLALM